MGPEEVEFAAGPSRTRFGLDAAGRRPPGPLGRLWVPAPPRAKPDAKLLLGRGFPETRLVSLAAQPELSRNFSAIVAPAPRDSIRLTVALFDYVLFCLAMLGLRSPASALAPTQAADFSVEARRYPTGQ
jgi:hypothetical protein